MLTVATIAGLFGAKYHERFHAAGAHMPLGAFRVQERIGVAIALSIESKPPSKALYIVCRKDLRISHRDRQGSVCTGKIQVRN